MYQKNMGGMRVLFLLMLFIVNLFAIEMSIEEIEAKVRENGRAKRNMYGNTEYVWRIGDSDYIVTDIFSSSGTLAETNIVKQKKFLFFAFSTEPITLRSYDENGLLKTRYTFHKNGKIEKKVSYYPSLEGDKISNIILHNDQAIVIQNLHFYMNGKKERADYYDANGVLARTISYDENGEIVVRKIYNNGVLIEEFKAPHITREKLNLRKN